MLPSRSKVPAIAFGSMAYRRRRRDPSVGPPINGQEHDPAAMTSRNMRLLSTDFTEKCVG
jgi:hypothetical protein